MKRLVCGSVLVLSVIALGAALGSAGAPDPAGTWQVVRSNSKSAGPCPMGSNGKGELTITRVGDALTLTYGKGMTCRPPEVCKLAGSVAKGTYTFTTTVPVDREGGKVTNSAEIRFASAAAGSGKGSSKYVHPSGMRCTWTFDLALSR
jgi:hypothetical protein